MLSKFLSGFASIYSVVLAIGILYDLDFAGRSIGNPGLPPFLKTFQDESFDDNDMACAGVR